MATSKDKTQLLRFSVVGSVDNGKSTLIGRLLLDGKMLKDDQLGSIKEGDHYNLARITDGLARERTEGITIDVAYRFFQTHGRRYIICDCPGHEEFTANMCSGTSQVDAAVVLVDATTSVTTQTKRHLLISALLGARSLIICINKLDLKENPQKVFERYREEIKEYLCGIEVETYYLPISALQGMNIVAKNGLEWDRGPTLLEVLESLPTRVAHQNTELTSLRVLASSHESDVLRVKVESGVLSPQTPLYAYPGATPCHVKETFHLDAPSKDQFPVGSTISMTLDSEVSDPSFLCQSSAQVKILDELTAMVIWFGPNTLRSGDEVLLKGRFHQGMARVEKLLSLIDINARSLGDSPFEVTPNQLARVSFKDLSKHSIHLVEFDLNIREKNEMIIICPRTNLTVGALIVRDFLN